MMSLPVSDQVSPRPTPVFWSHGFRPFFLAAPVYAVLAILYWILVLGADLPLPPDFGPSLWHGHEMLYGFGAATVAGFFLTATPNWTGSDPIRGLPLALLFAAWCGGRVAVWVAGAMPLWLVAIVDLAFLPLLVAFVFVPVVTSGLRRQLVFVPILVVLWLGNLLLWADLLGFAVPDPSWSLRLGIYVVVVLITIMGGRVIPSFTSNYLKQRDRADTEARTAPFEKAVIPATVLVLALDLAGLDGIIGGVLLTALALLHAIRMGYWRGTAVLDEPMLWSLHAGYAWLVIGFALTAAAYLNASIPSTAPLHALTIGGMGGLMLAVMSRATLGHSGRPIVATRLVVVAFVLLHAAAILRVFGPMVAPGLYLEDVVVAGVLWAVSFALFAVRTLPIVLRPHVDGRPG